MINSIPENLPEWKQAIIQWAISIDETPTSDPDEIASRLEPSLVGQHWLDATQALATDDVVAAEAIGLMEIF